MSQSTIAAPKSVEKRQGMREPAPPAPAIARAPSMRARVFTQLMRMLAQLAQR